jgi:transposase-like protein
MALIQAVPPVGDQDGLHPSAEEALATWMDFEVEGHVGVAQGGHAPKCQMDRHGYRARERNTRLGTRERKIPELRTGRYFPSFLETRRLSKRALTNQQSPFPGLGRNRDEKDISSSVQ